MQRQNVEILTGAAHEEETNKTQGETNEEIGEGNNKEMEHKSKKIPEE